VVGWASGVAARRDRSGVPGDRGRRALAERGNVGPDLQAVRLASDVRIGDPSLMPDVGERVIATLGEPAARELLFVREDDC
jgi:hypothetical protein